MTPDPEDSERGDSRALEVVYDYRTNAPADRAPGGRGYLVPKLPSDGTTRG